MLIIEKGKRSSLPKKYRPVNNLCAYIYDHFTSILQDKHFLEHANLEISLDQEKQQLLNELTDNSIHALDFLQINGMSKELTEILKKHVTMSILGDFVNFIYESLSCAQRGKMTVAYALLRKPLTDELLIFKQLLIDPDDFIQRFFHLKDLKGYDPSEPNLNRKQIINDVFDKAHPGVVYVPELIYDLRYEKTNPSGLNGISNQALHIVTMHKAYRTEDGELNFIFSNDKDHKRYWEHYYYFVPYLLLYAAHILDELVFSWMPDYKNLRGVRGLQRVIGFYLWSVHMQGKSKKVKASRQILLDFLAQFLNSPCENCGKPQEFEEADYILFFGEELLLCRHCYYNHLSSDIFLERINTFMNLFHNRDDLVA